jgi:hypothetical protein
VARVDERERPALQIEAAEQPGREALVVDVDEVLGQRGVRGRHLLEQGSPLTACVAQAADAERGGECARDAVTHRVGDGQVQRIPSEAVVECVAPDVGRRLQPGREGERAGFTGEGRGQQPTLDFRGKRERRGALPPFEKIGVPAVGDHDETEEVGRPGDLRDHRRTGLDRHEHLEETDHLSALGNRREHSPLVRGLPLDR